MLNAHNLCCRRGGRVIFRDAGFGVDPGGLALLTGANGSGKSSLLRILAGLLVPDAGVIEWQGGDIDADPASHRARLHYIGHLDALKPALTAREMLDYWQALRGCPAVPAALDAFALTPLADRPTRGLSAGQRRRLSLTRLFLSPAPLWLLDEPATALDRAGQALLSAHIARHRAAGGMVIAASHDDIAAPDIQRLDMARFAR